jgi:hypothetical protein
MTGTETYDWHAIVDAAAGLAVGYADKDRKVA